jgi:hypothetical protein
MEPDAGTREFNQFVYEMPLRDSEARLVPIQTVMARGKRVQKRKGRGTWFYHTYEACLPLP